MAQFLNNQSHDNTTGSNYDEEENLNNENSKTEKTKGSSSIDAEIIKSIQAQIASLPQTDEPKKSRDDMPLPVGMRLSSLSIKVQATYVAHI